MKYLSTTALAKAHGLETKELFSALADLGWLKRTQNSWQLTEKGAAQGGVVRTSKHGEYVAWPAEVAIGSIEQSGDGKHLNATALGKLFDVSNQRMNLILSELGLLRKEPAGWRVTSLGKRLGGQQREHDRSGALYAVWPSAIAENANLKAVFSEESPAEPEPSASPQDTSADFRNRFKGKLRTQDGHFVRSRAEVIICNALYHYGLVHAYERKVPVEEELYSDFYLPTEKVFIEFWGMENDPAYAERKAKKVAIYKKNSLNLIELRDSDLANLDDILPRKLLAFGIKVF